MPGDADEEGVQSDRAPVRQPDPRERAVLMDDRGDRAILDRDAARCQRGALGRGQRDHVVGEESRRPPLGDQVGLVGRHWREGQDAEPPVRDLVAVAVGAVVHAVAPALAQAGEVREFVHDPGRQDQPRRRVRRAILCGDREAVRVRGGGDGGAIEEGDGRVGGDLRASDGDDRARRAAILPEEAVRLVREAVATLPRVDDQGLLAGAPEGQGGGEAGVAAADDDDVVLHGIPPVE